MWIVGRPEAPASGVNQQLALLAAGGDHQRFGQHVKAVSYPGRALLPPVPGRPLCVGAAWMVTLVIENAGHADEVACTRDARHPDRVTRKIAAVVP